MPARRNTLAKGQAMEFSVWSDLIYQSDGLLHVFLPLLDRGLDAVIHRLTDGAYIPVQVKGRSENAMGEVELIIPGESLVDDNALLIASELGDVEHQMDLVVPEGVFKQLANLDVIDGKELYSAFFTMHPTKRSRWLDYLVPRSELARRVLGTTVVEPTEPVVPPVQLAPEDRHRQWLGFMGEAEVVRRLAESSRLDLFRPFPDLEMVEVLARDNETGSFAGLQVKTSTTDRIHGEAHFHLQKATLSESPSTWMIGMIWLADLQRFHEQCLFIPARDIPKIGVDDGQGIKINFQPTSTRKTVVDPYRHELADLAGVVLRAGSAEPTARIAGW